MGCRHDRSRLAWLVTSLVTASTVGTVSAVGTVSTASTVDTASAVVTAGTASAAEVRSSGAGPVRVAVEIPHRFGVAPESSTQSVLEWAATIVAMKTFLSTWFSSAPLRNFA